MAQLMPLPLTVSCFSKIQIGFTFLVPAHPGSPGQRAVKRVYVVTDVTVKPVFTARHYASLVFAVIMCPSVCLSVTSQYCIKTSWFSAWELPLTYPIPCCKEILIPPKIRVLPSGTFPKLRKCCHGKSVVWSINVVDGRACGLLLL